MARLCRNIVFQGENGGIMVSADRDNRMTGRVLNGLCFTDEVFELGFSRDFDGVIDEAGDIHIVMTDENGNLVYIRKSGERWIKAKIEEDLWAEEIFIFSVDVGVVVFYVSKGVIFSLKITDEITKPTEIRKTANSKGFFVLQKEKDEYYIFYTEEKGKFGVTVFKDENCGEFQSLTDREDAEYVFAIMYGNEVFVSYKTAGEIRFLNLEEKTQQSLTRRHTGSAQCPVIMSTRYGVKLCWLKNNTVFSSQKTKNGWQRLEENQITDFEQAGIFKFFNNLTAYKIGLVKNGCVEAWGEEKKEVLQTNSRSKKDEKSKTELIFEEIKAINNKIEEMNGKIDKMKRTVTILSNKKAVEKTSKRNLAKLNKK